MSYLSLSRKYRPRRFHDMIGQEAATIAIKNAIHLKREPHSVVFSGVRGIGKTTMARLYAKALNCESLEGGAEPCDRCESCMAINDGHHEDVLEIDGASHTGIDDIRALQETLSYVPQRSRYKVYTIDEVHMLSQSAFNALLKTLEEPPQHVVFIFATTELQKIPETILSRCQVFHLRRLTIPMIVERLTEIMRQENLVYETEALAVVAREGRGSMRDALTFLDQVIMVGDGQANMTAISSMIQSTSSASFFIMLDALLEKDANRLAKLIGEWDNEGWDFVEAAEQLAKYIRHAFVIRDLGRESIDTQMLGLSTDELVQLERLSSKAQDLDLNRLFHTVRRCCQDMNGGSLDRYILENYCFEWCFDPGLPQISDWQKFFNGQSVLGGSVPQPRQSNTHSSNRQVRSPSSALSNHSQHVADKPKAAQPALSLKDRLLKTVGQDKMTHSSQTTSSHSNSSAGSDDNDNDQESDPKKLIKPSTSDLLHGRDNSRNLDTALNPAKTLQLPNVSSQPSTATQGVPSPPPLPQSSELEVKEKALQWPKSWRDMVTAWMEHKPLEARLFEETYIIQYKPELIHIAVDPESMAAKKLFAVDARSEIVKELRQLFYFDGQFKVSLRQPAKDALGLKDEVDSGLSQSDQSLLDIKRQEKKKARLKRRNELIEHPLTKELVEAFDGKLIEVSFKDGSD